MNKSPRSSLALEMIRFILPLMMSGVLQQLYSWADAFIIGHAELSGSFYLLSRLRSVDCAAERAGRRWRYIVLQRDGRCVLDPLPVDKLCECTAVFLMEQP